MRTKELTLIQLSSLEKVFLDEEISSLSEINELIALKGERVSYQILYTGGEGKNTVSYDIKANEELKITVRMVGNVPSAFPARGNEKDEYYIKTEPGLYPDVLYPLNEKYFDVIPDNCHTLFITVEIPGNMNSGEYEIDFIFNSNGISVTKAMKINVLNDVLPEQKLTYTQWFHTDCIASYYNYESFSKEHWEMIEKYIEMAAHTGINLILTPLFTLPLDTEVGKERPTTQLVDIEFINGKYKFDFSKVKKWICLCKKYGINKFEMPHLFTQWGTGCTPKIEAETSEGKKNIFGWHMKGDSKEYKEFLNAFLPELTKFLKDEGVYENTYFHISDEPDYEKHREIYKTQRALAEGLIPKEKIIDAISHYEFFEEGIINKPVAITSSVDEFFKKGYTDIWTYYCCVPCDNGYSNRFIAMPSGRNRIIGFQLYKYNILGFLHWGFNFYYSQFSKRKINPFLVTDADEAFQSGDAFSVYPGEDGPYESIRSVVFYEGIQDLRACQLLEEYIGRDAVLAIIEENGEITFNRYPRTDSAVAQIRNRINAKLKDYIQEEIQTE